MQLMHMNRSVFAKDFFLVADLLILRHNESVLDHDHVVKYVYKSYELPILNYG